MTIHFSSITPHLQVSTIQKLEAFDFIHYSRCSKASCKTSNCVKRRIPLDAKDCTLNPNAIQVQRDGAPFSKALLLSSLKDSNFFVVTKILRSKDMFARPLSIYLKSIKQTPIRALELDCHLSFLDPTLENLGDLLKLLKVELVSFAVFNSLEHRKQKETKLNEFTNVINLFLNILNLRQLLIKDPYGEPKVDYFHFDELINCIPFSKIAEFNSEKKKVLFGLKVCLME